MHTSDWSWQFPNLRQRLRQNVRHTWKKKALQLLCAGIIFLGSLVVAILFITVLTRISMNKSSDHTPPSSSIWEPPGPHDLDGYDITCNPHPTPLTVQLPERCRISYANGTTMTSNSYETMKCSDHLCAGNDEASWESEWSEGEDREQCMLKSRCCCKAETTTNLTYICPSYFNTDERIVSDVATRCSCQRCMDIKVDFVVQVFDIDRVAISMANVTIDDSKVHVTDERGYVGFLIAAEQVKVHLSVRALSHEDFERDYFVFPGQVNILTIYLDDVSSLSLFPPQSPFLLRISTLTITEIDPSVPSAAAPQASGSDQIFENDSTIVDSFLRISRERITSNSSSAFGHGESFLYFPAHTFPPVRFFSFVTTPQSLDAQRDLETFGVPFVSDDNDGNVPRPLYGIAIGKLKVYDDIGMPFIFKTEQDHLESESDRNTREAKTKDSFQIITIIDNNAFINEDALKSLKLFRSRQGTFELLSHSPSVTFDDQRNQYLVAFKISALIFDFPLSYVVVLEEQETCYVATQAFDPLHITAHNSSRISTIVHGVARIYTFGHPLVYLGYKHIDSCLLVPCRGYLELSVLGDTGECQSEEQLPIRIQLDNFFDKKDFEGPVYTNKTTCQTAVRLNMEETNHTVKHENELNSTDSISLDPFASYCLDRDYPLSRHQGYLNSHILSSPLLSEQAQGDGSDDQYCSVQVATSFCPNTMTTVIATTLQGGDVQVVRLSDTLPSRPDDLVGEEFGSGFVDVDSLPSGLNTGSCSDLHYVCFSFPCDNLVSLSANNSQIETESAATNEEGVPTNLPDGQDDTATPSDAQEIANEFMESDSASCLPFTNPSTVLLRTGIAVDITYLQNLASKETAFFSYVSNGDESGVQQSDVQIVALMKCQTSSEIGVYFQCPTYE